MLDDRGDVLVARIDLFGDVNHLAGQLSLAIFDKRSKTLGHSILQ
jgi:hypothetical protein